MRPMEIHHLRRFRAFLVAGLLFDFVPLAIAHDWHTVAACALLLAISAALLIDNLRAINRATP